jgi:multidrug efflux pump subunit AcrA (membrane-fusion protein)
LATTEVCGQPSERRVKTPVIKKFDFHYFGSALRGGFMSGHDVSPVPEAAHAEDRFSEGGLRAPAHYGKLRKIWWWFDFLVLLKLARLRFIAILAVVGATILYWETLMSYYERWTRPLASKTAVVSTDTEYWCPMHPTIIRDKPDKCPICGMPLSKRRKDQGADAEEALPPGVVSRVQLTPYKVVNAGVQTVEVAYQPLTKEITTVGSVEYDERKLARISSRVTGKSRIDKLYVNVTGQMVQTGEPLAELYSPDLVVTVQNLLDAQRSGNRDLERMAISRLQLWGIDDDQIQTIQRTGRTMTRMTVRSPMTGYVIKKYQVDGEYVEEGARLYDVADLSTVWIEAQVYEDQIAFLKEGLPVTATTKAFSNREFCGKVAFIYPFLDTATRTVRVRFDMHNPGNELRRGMYATVTLQVPAAQLSPPAKDASEAQKRMHEQGLVLAVPERAVVDTGNRKIVYRETEQDTFEGVDVQLGPRCGAFYPVLGGLHARDRVAAAGSFLIDAETRLTAGASSTYFGASAGPQGTDRHSATTTRPSLSRDEEDKLQSVLAKLSPADRSAVEAQGYCPVLTDNRLGSMGKPVKVLVKGQPVFLCCKGCVNKALADPARTLAKIEEAKRQTKVGSMVTALAATGAATRTSKAAKIQAMLSQLGPEDRRLAEEQGYCPETERPLGAMGVPVKIMVKARPVFLCCPSCEAGARQNADKTLIKVDALKARAKTPSPDQ